LKERQQQRKSFITLTTGVNVLNSSHLHRQKVGLLFSGQPFQPSLMFVSKAGLQTLHGKYLNKLEKNMWRANTLAYSFGES
jgi:hypothetical protein